MIISPASALFIKPHHTLLRPHRRPKISPKKIWTYNRKAISDWLYYLGITIERDCRNSWRFVRKRKKYVFPDIVQLLKVVFCHAGRITVDMWNDIIMPFHKIWRSFKCLSIVVKSTKEHGTTVFWGRMQLLFKYGWRWNKYIVGRLMNYFAPLVSFVVCVIVILSMVHLHYAIEISYNGQTVGYVEHEEVYDSARKIIRNKLIHADDQTFLGQNTTMRITVVDSSAEISTQEMMAENILNASGDIISACGVYIGGMFYGASTAPDLVQQALDALKAPQLAAAQELEDDVHVKFARNVEFVEGIYPSVSVIPYDKLISTLTSQEPIDIYYNAVAGENIIDIAEQNGISKNRLQALNMSIDLDKGLEQDTRLLVATGEPLLRVKIVRVESVAVEIDFQTKTQPDPTFYASHRFTVSEGRKGEQVITYEYEYIDDRIVKTELSTIITRMPVNAVVIVGTKDGGNGSGNGTGNYIWPTGSGYYVSQNYSSTHFGMDIAAAAGTDIYAADDGVVITATQLEWDYGIYIIIDHQNGFQTLYGHNSQNLVSVGETVTKGQVIALMGSTGNSTGNHLHFEVRENGVRINPAPFIYKNA